MQRLLITVFCLFLAACGGGGGGGSDTSPTAPTTPTTPTVTTSVADYAGRYSGTVDYNLTQYKKSGVPMQADVTVDGKLTNVIINGSSTDATASTMLAASETNNNGVIQGSASYSVPNVPGTVYANYTGRIDVVSGAVSITYNMSGGLSGTIIVTGARITPVADTSGSATYISAAYGGNGTFYSGVLDGSKSTPNTSLLDFTWEIVKKPPTSNATIANSKNSKTTFTPDVGGNYEIKLTVSTSKYSTSNQIISIFADSFPAADAGTNQVSVMGTSVVLDASKSYDPEGKSLTYNWAFIAMPNETTNYTIGVPKILEPSSKITSFKPTVDGVYKVRLIVYDASSHYSSSTITVTVRPAYTDNGDGTFTDTSTGLMWQSSVDGVSYTWNEAAGVTSDIYNPTNLAVCKNLRAGGYADWRLPAEIEAKKLKYHDQINNKINTYYWTSTYDTIYRYLDPSMPARGGYTEDAHIEYHFSASGEQIVTRTSAQGLEKKAFVRCVRNK